MALKCEKCGGKLKLEENSCVCLDCGIVYNFFEEEKEISSVESTDIENSVVPTEEVIDTNTENKVEEESPTPPKKKANWLGWILGLSLVALLVYAGIWMSGSDERAIKDILAENGYYDLEIVATEDLGSNIEELAGNNKLVLTKRPSGEQKYGFGAVNIEDGTFQDFEFGYTPLNIIILKIFSSGEQMNIDNFNKAIEYVKQYGYYCLTNQEHAENYIRDITGENGLIPCEVARQAIIDNISMILPDIHSLPKFEVIFEDGNANPAYYAGLSSEMKYRWNHVFPESVYKVWEASVDRETQNITKAMYGQPYELQEVWAVVDKNLNEIGTYKSLESAKSSLKKLMTPTTSETASSETTSSDSKEANGMKGQGTINTDNTFEVLIDENCIKDISVGQKCLVEIEALNDKEYNGEIKSISIAGTKYGDLTYYPVKIEIVDADKSIIAGMYAKVVLNIEKKDKADTTTKTDNYSNPAVSDIKEKSENYEKKSDNEIIIGYTLYEPYNYLNSSNKLIGFDTELAEYIFKEMGYEPVFQEVVFDSFIPMLQTEKIDCFMNGLMETSERKEFVSFSNVYYTDSFYDDTTDKTESCPIVAAFKKNSELVSKFNLALSKAKQNGVIDNLKLKYNIN